EEYCETCDEWWQPLWHDQPHPPCHTNGAPGPFASYAERGTVRIYNIMGHPVEKHLVRFYPHGGPGGGGCCPCPAHAGHHTGPAKLVSVTSHIALTRADGTPLAVNSTVERGEPVIVAGKYPSSAAPWDARAVFEWDEGGGNTATQTNAFTVMDAYITADIDLSDTCYYSSNNVYQSLSPGPGGWAVPVTPGGSTRGHWFMLCPRAGLPGNYTVSLEGPTNALHVSLDYYGSCTPLSPGETLAVPAVGGSCYCVLDALAPCTGTLTYTFTGTGIAEGFNRSHSLPITVYDITAEPITAERYSLGYLFNPYGILLNGAVRYKIDVDASIPDSKITWAAISGNVGFNTPVPKGRDVVVSGSGLGDFKIEATIEGLALDPKPCFEGTVLEYSTVDVEVWIVGDGTNYATTPSVVSNFFNTANMIHQQTLMNFNIRSISHTNRTDWLSFPNESDAHYEMGVVPNEKPGLKVFFINRITNGTIGFCGANCIGIAMNRATPVTLAHELGHACGLLDIYGRYRRPWALVETSIADAGVTHASYMHPKDWAAGYYPGDLLHTNLITRLLMHGYAVDDARCIPYGEVYGVYLPTNATQHVTGMSPVGFKNMIRNPTHGTAPSH
ncbi:MAG: hypothetical protein FWG50_09105, partial [Kiritimatiellaeota bacterium]|nr:hypothetical protein [Kiritimatiellota bacterium]